MATTHLYALNSPSSLDWATAGVKAKHLWVWDGSVWRVAQEQWIWDGAVWQHGFSTTPGPLDHVLVDSGDISLAMGDTYTFTVTGYDADGLIVSLSGATITWSHTAPTDSLNSSTGDFTAGTTAVTDHVSATVVSGGVTYGNTVAVDVS